MAAIMWKSFKRHTHKIVYFILFLSLVIGAGRLYFYLTDGFSEANILSDLSFNEDLVTRTPTSDEKIEIEEALAQPYHYLAKGCQSYAFLSEDGKYVLKFFKYHRFREAMWQKPLHIIPYLDKKLDLFREKKDRKLTFFMKGWKLAYDIFPKESGVIFTKLNKGGSFPKPIILYDKVGLRHEMELSNLEFLIQRKAELLPRWIARKINEGKEAEVSTFLVSLVDFFVDEYQRGIVDEDFALIQNTGVYQDRPFHIDVGQFKVGDAYKDPDFWHQQLFNKFYKFRIWLKKFHPTLEPILTDKLKETLGDDYGRMLPYFGRNHDEL